ncbi:MAG: hypothetical protein Q8N23_18370 [Archangium sp.]|nr:hypothetical protein [Archangium sp.]MDP3154650.1 hypothetical protein [Archangium sp.]MDP3572722.1 hypothetical protein [Archangium sp.]
MRIRTLVVVASVVALPAFAQVQISVQLPTVTFNAPPPLVVVEPGVQVVEDFDEEVYFVSDYYWVRRGPRWYRTKDHRGGWVVVDGPGVPASIVRVPEGKYRRYKRGKTVIIDTPGPGKVKVKKHKGKGRDRDGDDD